MRAGALAECMHSDPSTVSRQVAALVKDGFIERQADPADGRASILVLTPKADAVLDAQWQQRRQHFATMLGDWSEVDLTRFAALLQRFTEDFNRTSNKLISERPAGSPRSAEGN
jgi:DNA-binding MarR family transcriptional regulator